MLRIFANTKVDFMRYRRIFIGGSLVANVIGLVVFYWLGVNLGIDFTGGTELQLKFATRPSLAEVRSALAAAGLKNPTVTTIGDPEDHELYIRVAAEEGTGGEDLARRAIAAVKGDQGQGLDINLADERTLRNALVSSAGMSEADASRLAETIARHRREGGGLIGSLEELRTEPGMTDEAYRFLGASTSVGPVALRAQNYVGPSVAPQLRRKAFWAVIASIIAMLIYIALRFRFQWGLGAILALVHDVIVTLGIFCISRKEFSLPVVASFLTLVGYSVNDTIVIFDRIRENLKLRGTSDLAATINTSVNQTLSRTFITSGLTWAVCVSLWLFGGEALNGFAFVLVIGILVGTYSTIYIASPVLIFWEWLFALRKSGPRRRSAASTPVRTKATR